MGASIYDSHFWPVGHVSGCQVVAVVAGVVPGLVHPADLVDGVNDLAVRAAVNDVLVDGKRFAVVVRTTDQELVARTLDDATGHTVWRAETGHHHRPIRI